NIFPVAISLAFDHAPGNAIQDNQSIFPILHVHTWDDEDRNFQWRNWNFPVPAKLADFMISAPRIDTENGHIAQVRWKCSEKSFLFVPRKRIRCAFVSLTKELYLRGMSKPSQAVFVHPLPSSKVQDMSNHLKGIVDGTHLYRLFLLLSF